MRRRHRVPQNYRVLWSSSFQPISNVSTIAVESFGLNVSSPYSPLRWLPLIALCLASLISAGCEGPHSTIGPSKATTSGKVLFQGKPLATGVIVFLDVAGDPPRRYGSSIADGIFECDVTPGEKRVEITAMVVPTGSDKPDPGTNMKQIIPAKYNLKSTLTVTVTDTASANKFAFDLKE